MPKESDMGWWIIWPKSIFGSRLCNPDEEVESDVWGKGTSFNMAIQVAAYYAIAMLREELHIPSKPPFQHFPQRIEMNGVF